MTTEREHDGTLSVDELCTQRNDFRKQARWAKLQETRAAAAAKHWTERVWYRHNHAGCSHRGKEQRHQRVEASKMNRNGAIPAPRRIKQRRDRKMAKNKSIPWQRRRRKVAPGRGEWKQLEQAAERDKLAIFKVRGALDKSRWSIRASESCFKKSMCMGRRTCT